MGYRELSYVQLAYTYTDVCEGCRVWDAARGTRRRDNAPELAYMMKTSTHPLLDHRKVPHKR